MIIVLLAIFGFAFYVVRGNMRRVNRANARVLNAIGDCTLAAVKHGAMTWGELMMQDPAMQASLSNQVSLAQLGNTQ